MTDDKHTIANLAKLLTEAQQENKRLRAENEKLRSKAAQWQNTFIALAEQHFAQGGKAPNLPMAAISCTVAPKALPFELINNNDYVTVVMVR